MKKFLAQVCVLAWLFTPSGKICTCFVLKTSYSIFFQIKKKTQKYFISFISLLLLYHVLIEPLKVVEGSCTWHDCLE